LDEEGDAVKLREFAGAIIRANEVFVFVDWGPGEEDCTWLSVSKNQAREITSDAKDEDRKNEDGTPAGPAEEIDAEWQGQDLYIGGASAVLGEDDDEEEPDEDEPEEDEPEAGSP
jgi:hypothetical protein